MNQSFNADGLTLEYPDTWKLVKEDGEEGWTVTIQSPGAAFAMIQLDRNLPDPQQMVEEAMATLKADYPQLDAESAIETLGGEMAIGDDYEFLSLDMVNSGWTRSFYALAGTVFLLCQYSDAEEDDYLPSLQAICKSIRIDEE
ncbi:MAG: hypothetical protein ACKO23_18935 [Gemmataceae bacterium]